MKKILIVILLSTLFIFNVNASEKEALDTLNNFINDFNNGNNESINYFDGNTEYTNDVMKYLGNSTIYLSDQKVELENNKYVISSEINANGETKGGTWSVNGFTVKFTLVEKDNKYIIEETNLFETIGGENIFKTVIIIMGCIFGFSLLIFIVVFTIIRKTIKKAKVGTNI